MARGFAWRCVVCGGSHINWDYDDYGCGYWECPCGSSGKQMPYSTNIGVSVERGRPVGYLINDDHTKRFRPAVGWHPVDTGRPRKGGE